MRKYLLIFMLISSFMNAISINAEWRKEAKELFSSAKEYHYIFDMSNTNYNGMDSVSFVEYNAAKSNMTPENYSIVLKYIGSEIKKYLSDFTKRKFSENSIMPFTVYIHLDEITEKAGMKVTVKVYSNEPENGSVYKFKVSDGRWNNIDILLKENAEDLAKKISDIPEFEPKIKKSVKRSTYIDDIYL